MLTKLTKETFLVSCLGICLLTTAAVPASAQQISPILDFTKIDTAPEFPGGQAGMVTYIKKNFTWPTAAREANLAGRVIVSFVVEKDGSLSDVKSLRDMGLGTGEEAVRMMKSMPAWKPGVQDGKPVRVAFVLPLMLSVGDKSIPPSAQIVGLTVIDGKLYTNDDMAKIRIDTAKYHEFMRTIAPAIKNMKILTPAEATEKYGEAGKNGARVIDTKPVN